MNERISELIKQTPLRYSSHQNVEFRKLELQKFAELIVSECMGVGEDVANADGTGPWFDGYVSGVEEVNRRIKQHFGVE